MAKISKRAARFLAEYDARETQSFDTEVHFVDAALFGETNTGLVLVRLALRKLVKDDPKNSSGEPTEITIGLAIDTTQTMIDQLTHQMTATLVRAASSGGKVYHSSGVGPVEVREERPRR